MPIPQRREIKRQLVELLRANGGMRTKDVYAEFSQAWNLSSREVAQERGGRPLYENEIRWARQELASEGIIESPEISGRAIWKLREGLFVLAEQYEEQSSSIVEGAQKQITVNSYERSRRARKHCLAAHGYSCYVCGFNFEAAYGAIGKECIQVHHLVEISSIGQEYIVNPIKDLIPICPNCHYIIHRRKPAFTVQEVRAMLKANAVAKKSLRLT